MHEYVIAMFLLVSCINRRNHLLYFARFCARSTSKIANKNLQQVRLRVSQPFPSINYAGKHWRNVPAANVSRNMFPRFSKALMSKSNPGEILGLTDRRLTCFSQWKLM